MIVGLLDQAQAQQLEALAERLAARGLAQESHLVRAVVQASRREGQEVPAAEAARILRVTPQTVRNWVRAGFLAGRQDRTGHFRVALAALEPAIRLRQAMPNVDEALAALSDADIAAEIAAVRAERRAASLGPRPAVAGE